MADRLSRISDSTLATIAFPLVPPTPTLGRIETPSDRPDNDFGRMVRLVQSNEQLFAALQANRVGVAEVRAYLARPDANAVLGRARLERLKAKHSAVLARLRANRIEARQLLAGCEADDPGAAVPLAG